MNTSTYGFQQPPALIWNWPDAAASGDEQVLLSHRERLPARNKNFVLGMTFAFGFSAVCWAAIAWMVL